MKLSDKFKSYAPPVDEDGWERIVQRPELLKYNRGRLVRRFFLYGIPSVLVVATIVTFAVIFKPAPQHSANRSTPAETNVRTVKRTGVPESVSTDMIVPSTSQRPAADVEFVSVSETQNETVTITTSPTAIPHNNVDVSSTIPITNPAIHDEQVITALSTEVFPSLSPIQEKRSNDDTEVSSDVVVPKNQPEEVSNENEVEEYALFIPNAFTPNGDGINDLFFAKADFEPIHFEMTIYNRKGEIVFYSKNINIGWDGMRYGTTLPTDVYTYFVQYTDPSGVRKNRKGQITLMK